MKEVCGDCIHLRQAAGFMPTRCVNFENGTFRTLIQSIGPVVTEPNLTSVEAADLNPTHEQYTPGLTAQMRDGKCFTPDETKYVPSVFRLAFAVNKQ